MVSRPRWVRAVLDESDLDAVARAVNDAEAATSGEIRVHLERRVPGARDPADAAVLARARDVFARLGMTRTRERNAVLLYLATEDHRLAIVGDEGVHARVGDAYWARIRDGMVERLRQGRAREALVEAVADIGRVLAGHFPRRADDVDELPDRPSLG
jgi:uncharacterized membrane protein